MGQRQRVRLRRVAERYWVTALLASLGLAIFFWVVAPWHLPTERAPGLVVVRVAGDVNLVSFEALATGSDELLLYLRSPDARGQTIRWTVDFVGEASGGEISDDPSARVADVIQSRDRTTLLMETKVEGPPRTIFWRGGQTFRYLGDIHSLSSKNLGDDLSQSAAGYEPYVS